MNHSVWGICSAARLFILMVAVLLMSVVVSGQAVAKIEKKCKCEIVKVIDSHLEILLQPSLFGAQGWAVFEIDGEPLEADVLLTFLVPPQENDDGTQSYLATIRYDFGDSNILTGFVDGILTPTEIPQEFINDARISYTGESGIYEEAFGKFDAFGFISFVDLAVKMTGEGKVCDREGGQGRRWHMP